MKHRSVSKCASTFETAAVESFSKLVGRNSVTQIQLISDVTVDVIESVGDDAKVVFAARTSSVGPDREAAEAKRGVKGTAQSLVKHRHGTPFEKGYIEAWVHAPIFVTREIIRHRIGVSPSEESGRYKELEPVFWVPRRDRNMVPVEAYSSMRPEFAPIPPGPPGDLIYAQMLNNSLQVSEVAWEAYRGELDGLTQLGIEAKIAREVARRHLPINTYSSMVLTFNPRSLMSFLSLRVHADRPAKAVLWWLANSLPDNDPQVRILLDAYEALDPYDDWKPGDKWALFPSYPQAEIEEVATVLEEVLKQGWPHTYEAFVTGGRVAP